MSEPGSGLGLSSFKCKPKPLIPQRPQGLGRADLYQGCGKDKAGAGKSPRLSSSGYVKCSLSKTKENARQDKTEPQRGSPEGSRRSFLSQTAHDLPRPPASTLKGDVSCLGLWVWSCCLGKRWQEVRAPLGDGVWIPTVRGA